jgi:hypothetical protein
MDTAEIETGTVLVLAEADYCYGVGPLTLRVTELGADPASFPRLEWVRVVGHEMFPDQNGGPREVMARVAALAASVQPARPSATHDILKETRCWSRT